MAISNRGGSHQSRQPNLPAPGLPGLGQEQKCAVKPGLRVPGVGWVDWGGCPEEQIMQDTQEFENNLKTRSDHSRLQWNPHPDA
jgi:hypothetical protein